MPSTPLLKSVKSVTSSPQTAPNSIEYLRDDIDDFSLDAPPRPGGRSGRRSPGAKGKNIAPIKGKRRRQPDSSAEGKCFLLELPVDVLHLLLCRMPPRTLRTLSTTCRTLREDLENESIWRESYGNRFLWDGAARDRWAKDDVKVLVQSCQDGIGKGWRKEALARETMLERWVASKQSMVIHSPPVGLIHSLSLSYPPYVPAPPKPLVVGKTHATPTKHLAPSPEADQVSPGPDSPSLDTPTKMTHRQRYEALLAATTRAPPFVLSAGLDVGGVIRSDPISGKVSKGYWGPGRDSNFHLRPHLDHAATPSAIYVPSRTQTHVLWGLLNGCCVHTTVAVKSQSSQGGRASSINVVSGFTDAHEGEVRDIWMPDPDHENTKWVTAGADGLVKLWQLVPGEAVRSTKKATTPKHEPATISCLFTSSPVIDTLPGRSEGVKRRQTGSPDAVIFARCDAEHNVVCGVTADGDLRVWFDVGSEDAKEVRIDVGSAETDGEVDRMELDVQSSSQASILIHHKRSPLFSRFYVGLNEGREPMTTVRSYHDPHHSAISAISCFLKSSPPISVARPAPPVLSTPLLTPIDGLATPTSAVSSAHSDPPSMYAVQEVVARSQFGRFVGTGDEYGFVSLWAWDGEGDRALRSWSAMTGKITAIDVSCGLVAVGSYDGFIKVFDPLPPIPTLLRTFHATHLSPADTRVAASDDPDSRYYTVNQIILENDLVVASIGKRVFAWKAGTGKGRVKGEGVRKTSSGRSSGRASAGNLDMKHIQREAVASHEEIQSHNAATRLSSQHERQQFAAMDDLGLEDGDDALQYALMLSLDEQAQSSSSASTPREHTQSSNQRDDPEVLVDGARSVARGGDAVAAVEAYRREEEQELREMLEMIRVAEEREKRGI